MDDADSTMLETTTEAHPAWPHGAPGPTVKQRTAVRHALSRLLDDLAPTGAPPRGAAPAPARVERLRFPAGCILQARADALSVSWFPGGDANADFGELVVIVWRGVVSRPGSARRERVGAVVVREMALRPVEVTPSVWAWQSTDHTVYDGNELAACCRSMLDTAIGD